MMLEFDVTARYLVPTTDGPAPARAETRLSAADADDARDYVRHVLEDEGCEVQAIIVRPAHRPEV